MADTTVHVQNISSQTSDNEIKDFFSFCGKISDINLTSDTNGNRAAKVVFEKPTAAKTALLLDNTQLGPNLVQVTGNAASETGTSEAEKAAPVAGGSDATHDEVDQEDKPRSRIVAEYLAHGYTISDKAIEKAISLDNQHGVSARFTSALQSWDNKLKASEKAQDLDQKYALSEKAASGWRGINSYFEKALGTPTGQKVREFYVAGNKQVVDVHNEARRLADLKAGKTPAEPVAGTELTTCGCGGDDGVCTCEPGKCACATCPRNTGTTSAAAAPPAAEPEKPTTGGPAGAF